MGRYLTEPGQEGLKPADYFKVIRPGELERIVKHGLKYFPIFQEYSTKLTHFTPENGKHHAREAVKAAQRLGVPPTVIYFAVDMDVYEYQVENVIVPYFKAIQDNLSDGYGVGIYASRNTCSIVSEHGYSISSFVSDMSTGFSGNLGFPIPANWNYDQFAEISGYHDKWDLDRVAYSGRVSACGYVSNTSTGGYDDSDPSDSTKDPFCQWILGVENECVPEWGLFLIRCMPIDLLLVSSFLNGFASQSTGLMAVQESSSCGIHILQSSAHQRKAHKLGRYA